MIFARATLRVFVAAVSDIDLQTLFPPPRS
jgi:hypothetical protein